MMMDTAFFIVSKLIGALLRPDTWIIILLAVVVLALIARRGRLALWVAIAGASGLIRLATKRM
jgi:hypothetical protein